MSQHVVTTVCGYLDLQPFVVVSFISGDYHIWAREFPRYSCNVYCVLLYCMYCMCDSPMLLCS